MDFLSFEHGMKVKPFRREVITIECQSFPKTKPKEYIDNPLFCAISRNVRIDTDANKDFDELIHNAQVAKRFTITATFDEFFNKPSRKYSIQRTHTILTPYQKYDKERQFTLDNIRTKRDFYNCKKTKELLPSLRSAFRVKKKISQRSVIKITTPKTMLKDYESLTLSNTLVKQYRSGKRLVLVNKMV